MNEYSFPEMISALQLTYINNQNKVQNNNDFWFIIDHLDNDKLHLWSMRMLKKRWIVQGKDFIKVCGVLTDWEQSKFWTTKQKRYLALMLISNWDEVSLDYIY